MTRSGPLNSKPERIGGRPKTKGFWWVDSGSLILAWGRGRFKRTDIPVGEFAGPNSTGLKTLDRSPPAGNALRPPPGSGFCDPGSMPHSPTAALNNCRPGLPPNAAPAFFTRLKQKLEIWSISSATVGQPFDLYTDIVTLPRTLTHCRVRKYQPRRQPVSPCHPVTDVDDTKRLLSEIDSRQ